MYNSKERYQLHWATIFVASLRLLREMLVPMILLIGLNGLKDGMSVRGVIIMLAIASVAVAVVFTISFILSYVKWRRFTYWFEEDELRIEDGVFVRNKRYIPFERIQSLNFTEPLAHRLFGLVKVDIETASGTGEAEASLLAVSKGAAEAIEYIIQEAKKNRIIGPLPYAIDEEGLPVHPYVLQREVEEKRQPVGTLQPVYTMTHRDLLILAVTSSGIGVMLSGILIFLTQFIDFIPFDFLYTKVYSFIRSSVTLVLLIVFVALLLTWLISIALTFISYHQFKVTRDDKHLYLTRGLIEKKRVTVPFARVQSVEFVENPLRQLFGYCTVVLHSAGGAGESARIAIFPLVKKEDVYAPLVELFPHMQIATPLRRVPSRGKHFFHRLQYAWALPLIGVVSYVAYPYGLLTLLLIPMIILHGRWKYRTTRYAYDDQQLTTTYRHVTKRTMFVFRHRIQSLTLRQSYFHKRKSVGTVLLYVKSGMYHTTASIPFMDEREAERVMDWYENKQHFE